MALKPSGKFGKFVKQYEKARRPYPKEIFRFFKKLLKVENPLILDLGCGTGISTRQMVRFGTVMGCDPDPVMLREAKKYKNSDVKKYVVGSARKLPFPDNYFDAVTAFSAFHWFYDKKSGAEIKRVLKPGGLFFTAGRTGTKTWGQGYRNAIIKTIKREIAQFIKSEYDPLKALKRSGFRDIKNKLWKKSELYTLPNALEYVQSVSIWESVPKHLRDKALKGVEDHFKKIHKKFGKIKRDLTVQVVAGTK